MIGLLTAFVGVQLADLVTWTWMTNEANPLVAEYSFVQGGIAKGALILLVCSVAAALVARDRYRLVAELLLASGIVVGAFGAGTNWANAASWPAADDQADERATVVVPAQLRTEAPSGNGVLASVASVGGWATWFDDGPGLYAAAGPALRQALGPDWRGRRVSACRLEEGGSGDCVRVVLSDWCACGDRHGRDTVLDLSAEAFRQLAPLSVGVIAVTVELAFGGPVPTLPATDVAP